MQWLPLAGTINTAPNSASITQLLAFEAPAVTFGTPLTSDPPEDQTILRIVAELSIAIPSGNLLELGLMVVDRTWTPVGTTVPTPDLDKRFLWYRSYEVADLAATTEWRSGYCVQLSATVPLTQSEAKDRTDIDISPKVKMEDGKMLIMVAYQSGAGTIAAVIRTMRLLMRRSRR